MNGYSIHDLREKSTLSLARSAFDCLAPVCYILPIANLRINNQITAPELRIIDENGGNVGVLKREEAFKIAQSKGLDLIEISPGAKPPVARIMNYDKFRYQQEKKLKKQKAQQKGQEMKQIQIGVGTAIHDLQIKIGKINDFLAKGHNVEIMMVLRGRQKANKDWARQKLIEFLKMIPDYKVVMTPRPGGRGFVAQITKK